MTADSLLNASDDSLLTLLQTAPPPPYSEGVLHTCTLFGHLHPNEAVRAACLALLQTQLDAKALEEAAQVLAIFQSVLEYLPWMGDYTALQAQNIQHYQAHKAPYEPLLMRSPVLVDRYLDLGRQLHLLFELTEEAKRCLEDIERHHPDLAEALYALGRIADHEGQPEKAAAYYERCLAQQPNHVYALLEWGILLARQEAYQEAIDLHQRVLELEPFLTEAHVHLATAHHAIGDLERAHQYLEAALGVNPHQEQALYWTGMWQWQDDNDVEAAVATFEKGVDHPVHGDSALLLAGLARLYAKQPNEPEKARTYYEKSLKANRRQPETFQEYIQLLEEHYQDLGEMQTQYEQYLELEPKEIAIYLNYADFLVKYLQDHAGAQVVLEQAQQRGLQHETLALRLAELSEQLDEDVPETPDGDSEGGTTPHHGDDIDSEDEEDDDDDDDDDDDFSGGGAAGDH